MRAYLVRHGEANPASADPERHLSEAGRAEAERVARFMVRLGVNPGVIYHSSKTRAAETAGIVARLSASRTRQAGELGATRPVEPRDGLAPNDPPGPVAEELAGCDEDVVLVGHLPFMAKLASLLLTGGESRMTVVFGTGGAACLERDDEGGLWRLLWVVGPGHLA